MRTMTLTDEINVSCGHQQANTLGTKRKRTQKVRNQSLNCFEGRNENRENCDTVKQDKHLSWT